MARPTRSALANAEHRELLTMAMHMQAPDRPDLLEKVVPQYPFGGKRPLVDNGVWIDALKRDNVDLITDADRADHAARRRDRRRRASMPPM